MKRDDTGRTPAYSEDRRLFMARYASEDERGALARLDACEDLIMGEGPGKERRIVEASMPAWLGIRYARPGRQHRA